MTTQTQNPTAPNPQLGPLRSEISFTLHTQHAHKLWLGRPSQKNKNGKVIQSYIPGIPSCLKVLNDIYQAAAQDDPYADDYLIRIEEKILWSIQEIRQLVDKLTETYKHQLGELTENLDFELSLNVSPIKYSIKHSTQLGYQLLYLLGYYDGLARTAMTAAHLAVLTNTLASEWIEAGAKMVRRCYGLIESYKHSGITRKDARENNARYQDAVKRMGYTVPDYVLSGERRADFAPHIRQQAADTAEKTTDS